ncbi:unnamed protein product [Sphagnum troendelagicum]|uniref:Protein farnesyltransferase subunit beta n=1 Tax=Sphagnum jensenii TaxID=128206 RepID=A0ABP0XIP5_9BRYO
MASSSSAAGAAAGGGVGEQRGSPSTSVSERMQKSLEDSVETLLGAFASAANQHTTSLLLELWRDEHVKYLKKGYQHLSSTYSVLDSSRPWLCYWILHSLAMLNQHYSSAVCYRSIDFLSRCQDKHGGYGGGPGQMPHLATTYAAVNALVTMGGEKALASIDREKTLQFFLRMKQPFGGFRMHDEGEIDVRGCYTAVSVAHILDIMVPELLENIPEYICSCQTYEGGIGGEPGAEAHGGYTYCGLATLALMNRVDVLDLPSLVNWVVFRQGAVEGGFQGRTNKLVDGCYSFWQGGVFSLLQRMMPELISQQEGWNGPLLAASQGFSSMSDASNCVEEVAGDETEGSVDVEKEKRTSQRPTVINQFMSTDDQLLYGPLFNAQALQGYILLCCQVLEGGLRDKPKKSADYYHTCYCLSGLTLAQDSASHRINAPPPPRAVLGPYSNLLEPVHPLCNVVLRRYYEAVRFFRHSPPVASYLG